MDDLRWDIHEQADKTKSPHSWVYLAILDKSFFYLKWGHEVNSRGGLDFYRWATKSSHPTLKRVDSPTRDADAKECLIQNSANLLTDPRQAHIAHSLVAGLEDFYMIPETRIIEIELVVFTRSANLAIPLIVVDIDSLRWHFTVKGDVFWLCVIVDQRRLIPLNNSARDIGDTCSCIWLHIALAI